MSKLDEFRKVMERGLDQVDDIECTPRERMTGLRVMQELLYGASCAFEDMESKRARAQCPRRKPFSGEADTSNVISLADRRKA